MLTVKYGCLLIAGIVILKIGSRSKTKMRSSLRSLLISLGQLMLNARALSSYDYLPLKGFCPDKSSQIKTPHDQMSQGYE